MNDDELIEKFVKQYGEPYRRLFTDSLHWLSKQETVWELKGPVDRNEFITSIVEKATPAQITGVDQMTK